MGKESEGRKSCMITEEQFRKARDYIYRHGRLLDRKRFEHHFTNGSKDAVIDVLACYQNADGGFGNGLEMDMMCPASTTGAAEIALLILDELGITTGEVVDRFENWCLTPEGVFPRPPANLAEYPHGWWWAKAKGPDLHFLAIAGLLGKWNRGNSKFFNAVAAQYATIEIPQIEIYHYTFYYYLRFAPDIENRKVQLQIVVEQLPALLESSAIYHPLFCYLWWLAADEFDKVTVVSEAETLVSDFEEDGGVKTPYPELPWWRPVMTLEALIHLKRHGLLNGLSYVSAS